MKPSYLPITRLSFPLATAIAALLFPLLAGTANATVYYWDLNGTTMGLGAAPNGTDAWGTTANQGGANTCLLYTSPSPRDRTRSRMPSSA